MSKINAFSRALNRKGKTRFFMDFQLVDNLNMSGTCKVRNEIETKRNRTKRNQTKRNETTLHFVSFDFVSFRFYFVSHFTGTLFWQWA